MKEHDSQTEYFLPSKDVIVPEGLSPASTVASELGAILVGQINSGKPYFWTSLKGESRADKLAAVRYLTDKSNGIDDILHPNTFMVKDVIVTMISFPNEEGVQINTPKVVLISPEGEHVSIIAKVWIVEFLGLFLFMGNPPWDEPVEVSAKQVKGSGANRYYTLMLP